MAALPRAMNPNLRDELPPVHPRREVALGRRHTGEEVQRLRVAASGGRELHRLNLKDLLKRCQRLLRSRLALPPTGLIAAAAAPAAMRVHQIAHALHTVLVLRSGAGARVRPLKARTCKLQKARLARARNLP